MIRLAKRSQYINYKNLLRKNRYVQIGGFSEYKKREKKPKEKKLL